MRVTRLEQTIFMPIHHLSPLFRDRCQSVSGLHEQSLDAWRPLVVLQTWCGRSFRKKIHLGSCRRLFVRIVTDRAISVLSFVELRSELFLRVRIRVSYKLFPCPARGERSVASWNFQLLGISLCVGVFTFFLYEIIHVWVVPSSSVWLITREKTVFRSPL